MNPYVFYSIIVRWLLRPNKHSIQGAKNNINPISFFYNKIELIILLESTRDIHCAISVATTQRITLQRKKLQQAIYMNDILNLALMLMTNNYPSTFHQKPSIFRYFPTTLMSYSWYDVESRLVNSRGCKSVDLARNNKIEYSTYLFTATMIFTVGDRSTAQLGRWISEWR